MTRVGFKSSDWCPYKITLRTQDTQKKESLWQQQQYSEGKTIKAYQSKGRRESEFLEIYQMEPGHNGILVLNLQPLDCVRKISCCLNDTTCRDLLWQLYKPNIHCVQ